MLTMLTTVYSCTSLHYCVHEHGWWWILMEENDECCVSCQQSPPTTLALPWAWPWLLTLWHSGDTSCTKVSLLLCCTLVTHVRSGVLSLWLLSSAVLGITEHTRQGLSGHISSTKHFSCNWCVVTPSSMIPGWCGISALMAWSAVG